MKLANALAVSALCAAVLVTDARAVEQNAPGMCSGASPIDERHLYRDVMHVFNGGPRPMEVVCTMANETSFTRLFVMLINLGDDDVPVTRTLTPARAEFNIGWAAVTETVIAQHFSYANVLFHCSRNADSSYFEAANWSCTLPPGMGMGAAWTDRVE
jgi:hypothetical protein